MLYVIFLNCENDHNIVATPYDDKGVALTDGIRDEFEKLGASVMNPPKSN